MTETREQEQDNYQMESLEHFQSSYKALKAEIHKVIVGQDEVIDSVLCCILAGGHCLVEGVPGLAKTLLVHAISRVFEMDFSRIQFTPDLMPSDILGSEIITESGEGSRREYRFVKGPVFSNIILADEINRTAPKTQSALLQAMAERQVSIAGRTYELDEPFFVMATQNPIEQEGTYPLPEAALDRFMFMIYIGYPGEDEEREIVSRTAGRIQEPVQKLIERAELVGLQKVVHSVPVSGGVVDYGVRLGRATRPVDADATGMVKKYIKWGAGPRAGQCIVLGARAFAVMHGRATPSYDDVRSVAGLVLRHRLITNFNAEADGVSVEDIIEDLLRCVKPK